nr:nitric oxide synthase-interacting protein [Ipomoea batatas]
MIYSSSRYVLIGNIVLPDFPISIFMVNVLFLKSFSGQLSQLESMTPKLFHRPSYSEVVAVNFGPTTSAKEYWEQPSQVGQTSDHLQIYTCSFIGCIVINGFFLRHRLKRRRRRRHRNSIVGRFCGAHTAIFLVRISDHNNRANTVLHTVITDGSKPAFGAAPGSAEAAAPHYHSAEPKPLNLQAQPLLHVVLLLRLLVRRRRLRHDGEVDGAPIGAVEDGGGADVEQDHGVARSEVVLDRPLHGVRALVAQIDGDGDFPLRPPGREARGGWLRHSKNNNDLAFFTYDEKRKLGYGTQKKRLS